MAEYDTIELQKIDADDPANESRMQEFDIRSIPTLILIDEDSGIVVGQMVGQKSEAVLREWFDDALEGVYSV